VLDNCEHVLDGAADLVERLLGDCPELRIVCTGRAPLGVEGEQVLRLAGLAVAPGAGDRDASAAAALYLDRAVAAAGLVRPGCDHAEVEELCRRLDGLPLAIELAAGRSRSMTPQEMLAALDERFGVLVASGRRATGRHATLRAAIDWSYGLLRDPQRRVFEQLSVFHRGCTLAAARDVCVDESVARDAVRGILDDLVAHSMLTADAVRGTTRYRLLESLRDYAADRLRERGQEEAARDRHARHYAGRVARVLAEVGSWRAPGLPHAREFDDLRAAIRWCSGPGASPARAFLLLGALWTTAIDRHAEEIAVLAEEVLDRHPKEPTARQAALGTAATARMSLGDSVRAQEHAEAALVLEACVGAPALIARRVLCGIAYQVGDLPDALRRSEELARRAREAGDEPLACETEGFTAQLHEAAGATDQAVALAFEMRTRADMLRAPFLASWSRYVSGVVTLSHDREEARRWFLQGLACARSASQPHMVRFSLRALGVVALLDGDRGEAARRLAAALEHADGTANPATQWVTLLAVALLLADAGHDESATALLAATSATPAAPLLGSLAVLGRLAARTERELAARLGPERLAAANARGRALDLAATMDLARRPLDSLAVSGS
jgi:predicted ATPase